MFEKIAKWVGKKFNILRRYYNGFETLEILGFVLGLVMLAAIFALGIAAIVLSGGTLPMIIAAVASILIVCVTAIGNYTNFFRAIGISINLMIDKTPPTYEKLGTAIGFGLGCVVVIALLAVGWPVAVPLLASLPVVLPWMLALVAVPLTVAGFQGAGRGIGRMSDRYLPPLKQPINFKTQDENIHSHAITQEALANANTNVCIYKQADGKHLDFWSTYFDKNTGINRASTYLHFYAACDNDLQRAIIFYTLLLGKQGTTLQDKVVEGMGVGNKEKTLATLGKYIHNNSNKNDREFIKTHIIEKLSLFANSGEKHEDKQSDCRAIMNQLKDIAPRGRI